MSAAHVAHVITVVKRRH